MEGRRTLGDLVTNEALRLAHRHRAHRAGVGPAIGRLTAACLTTWLPVNVGEPRGSPGFTSSTNRRGTTTSHSSVRRRHVLLGCQRSRCRGIVVRAEGIEPSFTASETVVLPLDEARSWSSSTRCLPWVCWGTIPVLPLKRRLLDHSSYRPVTSVWHVWERAPSA